ncbi:GNAT family N-acetyltransferase [Solwaraspora sp. WMMD406]|uniref:GNAT family N-acetyltransferase n=1 Tax=Solwaraspora sp. WMMD406 TaxID=3016095 RepID=UPI002417DA82|nr:GNAT family N-acetyltransferase [Solwaraspora sp. WMMD406]MDG4768282.1 GNAT family N-acetyltransferase [Solwaraspora sp. WMMD406]
MDLTVSLVDPADPVALDQAFEIKAAAPFVPDIPTASRPWFEALFRHQRRSVRHEAALAYLDGVPVGLATIEYPMLDNLDNAGLEVQVLPDHRRRGVGRALYAYAVDRIRAEGRTRLMGQSCDTLPGGVVRDPAPTAFALAMGAKSALVDARRRLDIGTADHAALDEMLTDGWSRAAGYELLTWIGVCPVEHRDDLAYLDGRMVTDAPMGDLEWEPEKVDADRIHEVDVAREAAGTRSYHTAVQDTDSGRIVAWTNITPHAEPDWHAYQQITIVDPDHRGHRLGLIVKVENLKLTLRHEPALRVIDTWNADSNSHMIAINEAIGFRPVDIWHNWQQTI